MKGFVLGVLVASAFFAGYLYWKEHRAPKPSAPQMASEGPAEPVQKKRRRTVRSSRSGEDPGPPAVILTASDLKVVGRGDNLSRPEVVRLDIDMDMDEASQAAELTQEDIDARFRSGETAILECIAESRPDPETLVPGRVTVKFRIQRTGEVRGVRVEAPAILQRGGIYECIKAVVSRLRFPPSGSSQIVTYPFTLS